MPGGTSIVDATAGPAREYPSSTKKQHRDWDKLESDVKQEEKDEKLDGEAGLQKFFQGLYGNLDEDARRAMNKSFQARSRSLHLVLGCTCRCMAPHRLRLGCHDCHHVAMTARCMVMCARAPGVR